MIELIIKIVTYPERTIRKYISKLCRKIYISGKRWRLKNKGATIVSSNCNGGVILHDLGMEFNSPFVNLFIRANDFIKLCQDLPEYMENELRFVDEFDPIYGDLNYPTAWLKDVKIYFMHYKTKEEAQSAWERRKQRMDYDNLFVMFTDRSGCTQKNLEDFEKLKYKNKVVFTHLPHSEIKSAFYIEGFESQDKVGVLTEFKNAKWPIKRKIDQFDYVRWLNGRDNKR